MALDKLTKLTSQSGIRTTLDYSMSDLTVDTITIRSGGGIGGGRINTGLVTVTTLTPSTVVCVGTGQTLTESDNLTWDNTNVRLKNLGITSTRSLNVTGISTFSGRVGIGTNSPTSNCLHIAGNGQNQLKIQSLNNTEVNLNFINTTHANNFIGAIGGDIFNASITTLPQSGSLKKLSYCFG